jgi:MoaA/NifB/PqqE/SkfB family radical SAM enzyme
LEDTARSLDRGPAQEEAEAQVLEGNLDKINGRIVAGWAWDTAHPAEPLTIEIYEHGTQDVLLTTVANLFRIDLRKHGKGDGHHGFSAELPSEAFRPGLAVSARVAATRLVLPGSPLYTGRDQQATLPDRASRLAGRFCPMPFEKLALDGDGAHLCCSSWLPLVVGDANTQSLEEIWNSKAAMEVRRSIIDGDFKYCLDRCPAIQEGTLPRASDIPADMYAAAAAAKSAPLPWGPKHLAVLYDRTCNLSCPSCRTEVLSATPKEREEFRLVLERVVRPALPSLKVIEFAGGEALASAHLRTVLDAVDPRKHPDLRVALFTNGTLFNRKAWDHLSNIHGIVSVYVSLDGATKATFEEIRRGGTWEETFANVEFMSALRRQGEIAELALTFVVQARNFREMADFVRLGQRLACDRVMFHELVDFKTYSSTEFRARSIVSPSHPLHRQLLAELEDPVFADPRVVLATFGPLRQQAMAARHASAQPQPVAP